MPPKKLKKGTLKRAWKEAKQKGIAKAKRAGWAMKRAWALTGSTKSPSHSSTGAKSTKSTSGGSSKMGNNGRKLRLNVSAVDVLTAGKLLGPAVPALNRAIYWGTTYGPGAIVANAGPLLDTLALEYGKANTFDLIGIPLLMQIGKRVVQRIFGVKRLTGVAFDGNYINLNV